MRVLDLEETTREELNHQVISSGTDKDIFITAFFFLRYDICHCFTLLHFSFIKNATAGLSWKAKTYKLPRRSILITCQNTAKIQKVGTVFDFGNDFQVPNRIGHQLRLKKDQYKQFAIEQ